MKIFLLCLHLYFTDVCQNKIWELASHILTWNDFRGKPDSKSAYNAGSQVEVIYGFKLLSDTITVSVTANFDQCKSWTISNDSLLLIHEQGHYDIAEIYARMLRQRIMQLQYKSFVQMLEDVAKEHSLINEQLKEEEEKYDLDTGHSFISVKQQSWNKSICQKLDSLEAYESSKCVLKRQPFTSQ